MHYIFVTLRCKLLIKDVLQYINVTTNYHNISNFFIWLQKKVIATFNGRYTTRQLGANSLFIHTFFR